jgi:hypothetical protein
MSEPGAAWAVITPDGELAWYPLAATGEVQALVGGRFGALDTSTLNPYESLARKVLASDVGVVYPGEFPANPLARRVITALSASYRTQAWHGTVALVEYETDGAEVLWPGEMSLEWAEAIRTAIRRGQDDR